MQIDAWRNGRSDRWRVKQDWEHLLIFVMSLHSALIYIGLAELRSLWLARYPVCCADVLQATSLGALRKLQFQLPHIIH